MILLSLSSAAQGPECRYCKAKNDVTLGALISPCRCTGEGCLKYAPPDKDWKEICLV